MPRATFWLFPWVKTKIHFDRTLESVKSWTVPKLGVLYPIIGDREKHARNIYWAFQLSAISGWRFEWCSVQNVSEHAASRAILKNPLSSSSGKNRAPCAVFYLLPARQRVGDLPSGYLQKCVGGEHFKSFEKWSFSFEKLLAEAMKDPSANYSINDAIGK